MDYEIDTQNMRSLVTKSSSKAEPNKYHDFDCCDLTRGIDTLMLRYEKDRSEITKLILTNTDRLIDTIWKQDGPLAIDNSCRCQMGKGDRRSPFACAQCKNMRRIIDFRIGVIGRPIQLQCGNNLGTKIMVTSVNVTDPFIIWDTDSARRARMYVAKYKGLSMCGTPPVDTLKCVTGDSFTIMTLITWMIDKIFTEKGLPHIGRLHTAFICSGVGYSVSDVPTIGTISDLNKLSTYHAKNIKDIRYKPKLVLSIIVQLLVILLELSKINFSHGTPSINGLIFNKSPVSYKYDGIHVNGEITLQISDLQNSSATFNSVHFFPKNIKAHMYIERNIFTPEISTKTVSMSHSPDQENTVLCNSQLITLYRLTNSTVDIYNAMRHIGFPLYVGSFDFYCFMVSLMCDKSFAATVTNDDKLYHLWSMMWLVDDLPLIEERISEMKGDVTSTKVIDIIRGAWIRCDIITHMWSLIKN